MRILIAVCVFMGMCAMCEGCRCSKPLTNKSFGCRSDFIIKTEVLSDMMALVPKDPSNMYYKIRTPSHIYKFKGSKSGINFERVYTAENSAMCGVTLDKGYTYILSGTIDTTKKRLTLNSCVSWTEKSSISLQSRVLLTLFEEKKVNCSQFAGP
ncbi:uncharacterized protein LOC127878950 [Dreissena polymorpha]|uniref:uncharacterized protein LOC127878950 n=1 Tax=Dreissena polymorpha TaxID=45954 RepID=UPI002264E563|nr:uncharacterized protein LOC127878950 [Dreissena polymorpha]